MNPEISVQRCLVLKNIMNIVLVFFGPKNITFHNILTQKYRTYLPVCVCAECPPGMFCSMERSQNLNLTVYKAEYPADTQKIVH